MRYRFGAAVRRCGKAVQVVYLFLLVTNKTPRKGDITYEREKGYRKRAENSICF
jgi:hypothetical protein